jgi:hypothetical protein
LVEQWQQAHADREIVTEDWLTTAIGMVGAIAQNEFASQLLNGRGMTEVSLVWDDPDTDIRCKCRVDKLTRIKSAGETSVTLTDLKTTRDASQFEKAIANFAYHRQAAFYADGAAAVLGETMCGLASWRLRKNAVRRPGCLHERRRDGHRPGRIQTPAIPIGRVSPDQ